MDTPSTIPTARPEPVTQVTLEHAHRIARHLGITRLDLRCPTRGAERRQELAPRDRLLLALVLATTRKLKVGVPAATAMVEAAIAATGPPT